MNRYSQNKTGCKLQ